MSLPRAIQIEQRSLSALIPYAKNARTHSDAQIAEIAGSIRRFGFVNPVLVGDDDVLIAGHGRVLAARLAGIQEVPAIVLAGLTERQRRALALADNRIALNSGWDAELLRSEIEALQDAGEDIDGLGFGADELAGLFDDGDPLTVKTVETRDVSDRFWISIRGPLKDQAEALQQLQSVMASLSEVEVELGTIAVD